MAAKRPASTAPGVAEAIAYAEAVVAGQVPAGRLARLACERFLRDKAAADAGTGPWGFDADLVEAALLFAGQMPNIKGPEAGRPLRLLPWQRFVFANLFGFVERGTSTRRFRQAVVYVPRGNGKTTLAAPIGLYLTFVEGEGGAEGYAAAVTRDQARILFDAAQNMVRRSPGFRAAFGVGVGANAIHQERTASRFAPVSSDAKALDGLNVQVAVCDEIASHKTPEVYDVLLTAMGKRRHPLLLSISTATGNNTGIGKQLWDYAARVLDGTQEDERLFALVHPRRRSGGRPLGGDDLDQGESELGAGRPAGRHPRHHAPGQEQPRPVLELDAAMRSGRLRHDGDPVLEWCVGNVVGRPDRRGNLYPAKQRPEQTIDAAVARMVAVGRTMAEDTNEGDLTDFLRDPLIA